jgi:hypothetical protein
MTPNPVVRVLWRRRVLVLLGSQLALALTLKLIAGAAPPGGIATTKVLVDTPRQQLVDRTTAGVETLGWRTAVLADLLGTDSAKQQIARYAQIPEEMLSVVDPELNLPTIPASLPEAASKAAAESPTPYVLTTRANGVLPLIRIRARAPDRDQATRLAEAAVSQLESGAVLGPRPDSPRFVVTHVAQIDSRAATSDPEILRALALGGTVFCLWCAAIIIVSAGLDWWRGADARGRAKPSEAPGL